MALWSSISISPKGSKIRPLIQPTAPPMAAKPVKMNGPLSIVKAPRIPIHTEFRFSKAAKKQITTAIATIPPPASRLRKIRNGSNAMKNISRMVVSLPSRSRKKSGTSTKSTPISAGRSLAARFELPKMEKRIAVRPMELGAAVTNTLGELKKCRDCRACEASRFVSGVTPSWVNRSAAARIKARM